jgi:hypothetical protein
MAIRWDDEAYGSISWDDLGQVEPGRYDPTEGMSGLDKLLAGVGKSYADLGRGVGQMLGIVPEQEVAEARARDQALMKTGMGQVGSVIGDIALTLPLGIGAGAALKSAAWGAGRAGAGRAASLLNRAGMALSSPTTVKGAAAQGALMGGLQPTTDGESRLANAALSGAVSGAVQAPFRALARTNAPVQNFRTPYEKQLIEDAERLGYKLTPAQKTGNPTLAGLESALESLPGSGEAMKALAERNAANTNRIILESLGETGTEINNDILGNAMRRIGRNFESVTTGKKIGLDMDYFRKINGIINEYEMLLPEEMKNAGVARALSAMMDEPFQAWRAGGDAVLDGRTVQKMRSFLTDRIMASKGETRRMYGKMVEALDEVTERSLPREDMQALRKLREQWKTLKVVEKARSGSDNEVSLKRLDTAAQKARLKNDVAKAAEIARVLDMRLPNSGTAPRTFYQNALTGQGLAGIAVPALAGAGIGAAAPGNNAYGAALGAGAGLAWRRNVPRLVNEYLMSPLGQRHMTVGLLNPPSLLSDITSGLLAIGSPAAASFTRD